MTDNLDLFNKIGVLDPEGENINPMNNQPFSEAYKALGKVWSSYPSYSKADEVLGSGKTVLI